MEYQLLMGREFHNEFNKAIEDWMWFQKHPALGPEQKWFYPRGFFEVLKPFRGLANGDIILIDSYPHSRVVKMATSTKKQEFINYSPEMNAHIKLTPHEYSFLHPLTYKEIYKLLPHMSTRIRKMVGYSYWSKQLPEWICADCASKMPIEFKGEGKYKLQRRCNKCGTNKAICNNRSDFKPKAR